MLPALLETYWVPADRKSSPHLLSGSPPVPSRRSEAGALCRGAGCNLRKAKATPRSLKAAAAECNAERALQLGCHLCQAIALIRVLSISSMVLITLVLASKLFRAWIMDTAAVLKSTESW